MNRHRLILLAGIFMLLPAGCGLSAKYIPSEIRSEYAVGSLDDSPESAASSQLTISRPVSLPYTSSSTSLPAVDCTEQKTSFTLSMAINAAIENNPDLKQAVHRITQAKAIKELSDTTFWPAISLYTEYMQGDAPSAYLFKSIDQRQLPKNINFNDPGWFENFETGISARMNLYNGGRDYLGSRIAGQDVDISDLDRQSVINELTAQVIAAFYDVLASGEFVEIAVASVATVSEQLRIITVQYEGGGVLKSDVLSLKVRLARAKESLVESQKRYKLAKAALAHLMGYDPAGVSEDLKLTAPATGSFIDVPATCEEGIIYAIAHRPELEKTRKLVVKSRMGLDASKSDYLPRIDVMGKYYVDDPHMEYDRDRDNWTAAVIFNWDLFTGLSTRARIKKADALVKEMLAADRKAVLNVRLDVQNSFLNLEAAVARYEVAQSSVENAEESYRLVKEYYKGGSVTITRYLEAELDRNRAHIRSTAAYYERIKANAEFARAIGKLAAGNP